MKTIIKIFVFTITTALYTTTMLANTTEVKAPINHLTVIETEVEEPVDDIYFTIKDVVRYTKLNTQGVEPDSAEVEEEPVNDVQFTSADAQHYQNQQFELLLKQLIPIMEEQEEASSDLYFTKD